MAGDFDHLHLKRNTAGSSNELSFDVLDAARSGLDGKRRRRLFPPRMPRAPKGASASQTGYSGVATTKTSRQQEVERRKKARRARKRRVRILAATVVLAVLFAVLWFGYRNYIEVQDFNTRFVAIVNQFVEEDEFLVTVDELMQTVSDDGRSSDREAVLARFPDMRDSLEKTFANARSARALAVSGEDRAALDQVMETADARSKMLESAQTAFVLAARRDEQIQSVNSTWNKVVSAGQEAKEAAAAANEAQTEEATTKAREQTETALEELEAAGKGLKALSEEDDRLDVSAQSAYIEKRAESLRAALATADALLAGDRELARAKNDEYNEADKEAADLAEALPPSPEETVRASYAPDLDAAAASYFEARERVVATDSLIREYLEGRQ